MPNIFSLHLLDYASLHLLDYAKRRTVLIVNRKRLLCLIFTDSLPDAFTIGNKATSLVYAKRYSLHLLDYANEACSLIFFIWYEYSYLILLDYAT